MIQKIQDIKPNPKNPRRIKGERVEKLAGYLQEFGDLSGIVINSDGTIISGHQRHSVFVKQKGSLTILERFSPPHTDGTIARGFIELKDGTRFVFRQVDWDTEKAERATIVANGQFGEWDSDILANEWDFEPAELKEFGVPDFVFGGIVDEVKEAQEDNYEIPEEGEIQTKIQRGDIIEIGPHRLLCGDSTDPEQVKYLMNGELAEIIFTSPPYSDMRDYGGDIDLSVEKVASFIPAWRNNAMFFVVNLGLQRKDNEVIQYWDEYIDAAKRAGLKFLSWNVWDKTMGGSIASATSMFLLTHEWIFVFGRNAKKIKRTIPNQVDKYVSRHGENFIEGTKKTFRVKNGSMEMTTSAAYTHHQLHSVLQKTPELGPIRSKHPATFPVGLVAEYINAMCNDGEIVADPFCGSGTTMVAAHQLGRICYGMEIEPKYCQVIVDRMRTLDPQLTIKINKKEQETGENQAKNEV